MDEGSRARKGSTASSKVLMRQVGKTAEVKGWCGEVARTGSSKLQHETQECPWRNRKMWPGWRQRGFLGQKGKLCPWKEQLRTGRGQGRHSEGWWFFYKPAQHPPQALTPHRQVLGSRRQPCLPHATFCTRESRQGGDYWKEGLSCLCLLFTQNDFRPSDPEQNKLLQN